MKRCRVADEADKFLRESAEDDNVFKVSEGKLSPYGRENDIYCPLECVRGIV